MAKDVRGSSNGEVSAAAKRRIVLLSDGTGNGSASVNKSNVWRIFQAIETGPGAPGSVAQLAFYDDGVGTSGFRPWQLISQAFGFGLFRNVKQLYLELCRHYRPGDEIFMFGFSRGAFTIRVLAHLICVCGILDRSRKAPNGGGVKMDTDYGLDRGAREAYKAYRRIYWSESANGWLRFLGWVSRTLRGVFYDTYTPEKFLEQFSFELPKPDSGKPLINFIGVFDTVDAHGLPVEELSDALNQLFYPYKFPDFSLNPLIGRARQALAIDDERHTFSPLLWDENGKKDPDRIRQVWFAGMHADIGGGYPEDNLALTPLVWMIEEAEKLNLKFHAAEVAAYRAAAQPTAKMHDSRRGVAVYYRYRPREISLLVDRNHGATAGRTGALAKGVEMMKGMVAAQRILTVRAGTPLIHYSVIERIRDKRVGYAPTALDGDFNIWLAGSAIESPGEKQAIAEARTALMDRAAGHIFWRRVCYYGMLAPSLFLGWMAISHWYFGGSAAEVSTLRDAPVAWLLQKASGWFSGFPMGAVGIALESWAARIDAFLVSALLGVFFYFWGNLYIAPRMVAIAENGWAGIKHGTLPAHPVEPGIFERIATAYLASRARSAVREIWRLLLTLLFAAVGVYVFCYLVAVLVPKFPWPEGLFPARLELWPVVGGIAAEIVHAVRALFGSILG